MEIQRCAKLGKQNYGYINPEVVNEKVYSYDDQKPKVEKYILHCLLKQHYKPYIFLPFNYRFHWILLIIELDNSKIIVQDSRRKPQTGYQWIIDLLNSAFRLFQKRQKGQFKNKFDVIQSERPNTEGDHIQVLQPHRVHAFQEQLIGFIFDEIINPAGAFYTRMGHSLNTAELMTTSRSSKAEKSDARKK